MPCWISSIAIHVFPNQDAISKILRCFLYNAPNHGIACAAIHSDGIMASVNIGHEHNGLSEPVTISDHLECLTILDNKITSNFEDVSSKVGTAVYDNKALFLESTSVLILMIELKCQRSFESAHTSNLL